MKEEMILKAKDIVKEATSITVLTGAGISAESGVPTFRGKNGLWKNFRPEELATPQAFARNPQLVWEWYEWRRKLVKEAKPNPGHLALVKLEEEKPKFTLITQNVDGLHKMAGNKNIVELHGNLWQIRCTRCGFVEEDFNVPLEKIPPECKKCGGIGRPNVVWFGEIIPMSIIERAIKSIEECQVMLIVGTSGVVEPAASLGLLAKQTGKVVIEVNLEPTLNSTLYDLTILGKSGEVLPLIVY